MEVRLEGITKSFGDFTAVNNLNVTIEDGTLAGLLGTIWMWKIYNTLYDCWIRKTNKWSYLFR